MPLAVLIFTIVDIAVRKLGTTLSVSFISLWVGVSYVGLNGEVDKLCWVKSCQGAEEGLRSREAAS